MKQSFNSRQLFLARTAKKMSRREVGEKVGVVTSVIQAYEEGKSQPKLGRINELAKAVGLSPYELLNFNSSSDYNKNIKNQGSFVGGNNVIHNNYNCNEKLDKIILEICDIDDAKFTKSEMIKILLTHKKKEN